MLKDTHILLSVSFETYMLYVGVCFVLPIWLYASFNVNAMEKYQQNTSMRDYEQHIIEVPVHHPCWSALQLEFYMTL